MMTVTKPASNRVDLTLNGGIDSNIMAAGLDALIKASDGVENGQMLYTIKDFSLPTLGAIITEFSRLGGLLALLSKFERCAVLCDTGWIRTASEIEGAVLPGLDIKSFQLNEKDAAEAWLSAR